MIFVFVKEQGRLCPTVAQPLCGSTHTGRSSIFPSTDEQHLGRRMFRNLASCRDKSNTLKMTIKLAQSDIGCGSSIRQPHEMQTFAIELIAFILQQGKIRTKNIIDILVVKETGEIARAKAHNETVFQSTEHTLIEFPIPQIAVGEEDHRVAFRCGIITGFDDVSSLVVRAQHLITSL